MKLDLFVYNNTSIVGLIYLPDLCAAPVITFVRDSEDPLTEEQKRLFPTHTRFIRFDKELTVYLKRKYKSGDMIKPEDYMQIAVIYDDLINQGLDLYKRDNNFYELACCSGETFILMIMEYLRKNLTGVNREYYFKCAEILEDAYNGIGYRIQAYCYQEGIYVKKSKKPIYGLIKKAAECGDEQSIELIKQEKSKWQTKKN
ncbi:hypothetical protein [Treponema sp.]|uniref:hypothetical protein n=1 Tax=Treponema sp. TaxID=166 RepID=UPI00298E8B14|nr:hypothetical protein [Treponema sp.]MCQ2240885.1 hypothetical protein [Treponema sp.]